MAGGFSKSGAFSRLLTTATVQHLKNALNTLLWGVFQFVFPEADSLDADLK
jgi:hypothetical protein